MLAATAAGIEVANRLDGVLPAGPGQLGVLRERACTPRRSAARSAPRPRPACCNGLGRLRPGVGTRHRRQHGGGLIEANRTGGSVNGIHCGWAAHSGVTAAALAAAGVTGPPTVLEGRPGFFNAATWTAPTTPTPSSGGSGTGGNCSARWASPIPATTSPTPESTAPSRRAPPRG
ncbi:MmgE/PrpD family protein [Yinghuangia aomiensis]